MKDFTKWLSSRKFIILLLILCSIFIVISGFASGNRMDIVLYSLLICAFFTIIFAIFDYIKFHRINIILKNINNSIIDNYDGVIDIDSIPENYYKDIIVNLDKNISDIKNEMQRKETDAKDYYTLWTHQIKTPIAAMNLILSEDKIDNRTINLLKSELFRIERYSEMTLQYTRLESISEDMIPEKQNIRDIVALSLKKYVMLFSIKKLSLDFREFELFAVTDKKWMEFVIEQIISNSIKYTTNGGISIYTEGNILIIEDTGTGITKEDLPLIFERSYTGYNGRIDSKASGLGLYLCRKIINKLHHKISITSEIGVGTKVFIDFTQENILE